jgi:hypothetical protein
MGKSTELIPLARAFPTSGEVNSAKRCERKDATTALSDDALGDLLCRPILMNHTAIHLAIRRHCCAEQEEVAVGDRQLYFSAGRLVYAGRVRPGRPDKLLADLRRRLEPLARASSPLRVPSPRSTRFGSPLVVSRVRRVERKLVAGIWTNASATARRAL